jgi:mannosyl-oligosaccharide alpha-1,2-mannosidase
LSQLTGDDKYYDAIDRMRALLERTQEQSLLPGMWPTMFNFREGTTRGDDSFSLGALADSLYEYLPKMFILLSGRQGSESYEKMYRRAMEVVIQHILFRPMLPEKDDFLFAGTSFVRSDRVDLVPEMQHLTCFIGGMFALGGKIFNINEHVNIGDRIARGCGWVYQSFPTGVMPEIYGLIECPSLEPCDWDDEKWKREGDQGLARGFRHARDPRYLLRPEAIESIFIMYRISGKEDLRDVAWNMFESIMKSTTTPLANSAIKNVTVAGETEKEDSMEVGMTFYYCLVFMLMNLSRAFGWQRLSSIST